MELYETYGQQEKLQFEYDIVFASPWACSIDVEEDHKQIVRVSIYLQRSHSSFVDLSIVYLVVMESFYKHFSRSFF